MSKLLKSRDLLDVIKNQERRLRTLERIVQQIGGDAMVDGAVSETKIVDGAVSAAKTNIAKLSDIAQNTGTLRVRNADTDQEVFVMDADNLKVEFLDDDGSVIGSVETE